MIAFEKYLLENGFEPHYYIYNAGKIQYIKGYRVPSTMGNIYNLYIKNDIKICVGLNEAGKPVTLIYPRNGLDCEWIENEDKTLSYIANSDDVMNKNLMKMDNELILKTILK